MTPQHPIRSLSFVGLGKLGLPLAACFGASGVPTVAIDTDERKIETLKAGSNPIEEPGLDALLELARGSMEYAADYGRIADTDATIFLLPTPTDPVSQGFSDTILLAAVTRAAEAVAAASKPGHCFIVSSTVMPDTMASRIGPAIAGVLGSLPFGLAYVPDFVALGDVIRGFRNPAFLLVGCAETETGHRVAELYSRIMAGDVRIELTMLLEAEIAKVSLNTYLCVKISFANFLGQYCARRPDIDVDAVTRVVGLDPRIGGKYFSSGMAYGGACFPRDTLAFRAMARAAGLEAVQVEATETVNEAHKAFTVEEVARIATGTVAVLGIAFKPGTPAIDASPSVDLVKALVARGFSVRMFDYSSAVAPLFQIPGAEWCRTLAEAVEDSDCVVIAHPDKRFGDIVQQRHHPTQKIVDFWRITNDRRGKYPSE